MKLFLDDTREAPEGFTLVRDPNKLIHDYVTDYVIIEEISLDHDLGLGVPTGYDFLKWVEKHFAEGFFYGLRTTRFSVHSANPVGRKNMEAAIRSIERLKF